MIEEVLEIIKEEIDTFLKLKIRDSQEHYIKLVPVVDMEGKPSATENTVCMSLVRIEEDGVNMSNPAPTQHVGDHLHTYNAPIKLNLYVLLSASYIDGQEKNYLEALKRLSHVISFFQAKNVFTSQNTPRLSPDYGKIKVDLFNQGMEETYNLWSMLGSLYRPSVLYRFRALMVQESYVTAVSEPTIDSDFQLKDKKL